MHKDNAELRTFIDYGFSGFPEILPLRTGKKVPPAEILLPRSEVVSRSYLLSQIAELARNKSLSNPLRVPEGATIISMPSVEFTYRKTLRPS